MNEMTAGRLRQLLTYDPGTGVFRWLVGRGGQAAGSRAGCLDASNGYRTISIDSIRYYEHRVAWFYVHEVWPECEIDHRNLKRDDNRFENLREASHVQNLSNRYVPSNNTSGFAGVCFDKSRELWQAQITLTRHGKKKTIHLGRYRELHKAAAVRRAAELQYFGEFARG